jgi:hypothetical protein
LHLVGDLFELYNNIMFILTEYMDLYYLIKHYERRNFIKVDTQTKIGVKLVL